MTEQQLSLDLGFTQYTEKYLPDLNWPYWVALFDTPLDQLPQEELSMERQLPEQG